MRSVLVGLMLVVGCGSPVGVPKEENPREVIVRNLPIKGPSVTLGQPEIISLTVKQARMLDSAANCRRGSPETMLSQSVLLDLLLLEEQMGVPEELRGFILAIGCSESGLRADAEGDHRFSKDGEAKAVGLVQMWGWWEKAYGVDRTDPYDVVEVYLTHVEKQSHLAAKRCGYGKDSPDAWIVGQVRSERGSISRRYRRALLRLPQQQRGQIEEKYGVELTREGLKHRGALAKRIGRAELSESQIRWAERCFEKSRAFSRFETWRRNNTYL